MNQEILKSKQEIVSDIVSKAKDSSSVVLAEYRGLTVEELTLLRRELRKSEATLGVYKNTLASRAFKELNIDLDAQLVGPNAIVFSKDALKGPSVLLKFSKDHKKLVIKAGYVDGKIATADEVKTLAALPGREGLISMFLCCLKEPVAKFARALDAIAKVKNA